MRRLNGLMHIGVIDFSNSAGDQFLISPLDLGLH